MQGARTNECTLEAALTQPSAAGSERACEEPRNAPLSSTIGQRRGKRNMQLTIHRYAHRQDATTPIPKHTRMYTLTCLQSFHSPSLKG